MVESSMQPQEISDLNLEADPSSKQFVLIIGDIGDGKSTLNNALIGAHKNEANDEPDKVTKNFQMHSSILPEFKDTVFIDSPGFINEYYYDLDYEVDFVEIFVKEYNRTIGQQNAPRLSLVVYIVDHRKIRGLRPDPLLCLSLATLLSCVEELHEQNFVVVFNKCPSYMTVARVIKGFEEKCSLCRGTPQIDLTEKQVLVIRDVGYEQELGIEQEVIESTIRPQVVKFISEKLNEIRLVGSVIQQKQTTVSEIFDNTGESAFWFIEAKSRIKGELVKRKRKMKFIQESEFFNQLALQGNKEDSEEVKLRRLIFEQEFEREIRKQRLKDGLSKQNKVAN